MSRRVACRGSLVDTAFPIGASRKVVDGTEPGAHACSQGCFYYILREALEGKMAVIASEA